MPNLITKIGADSSQLRQDVGELPNVVKKSFDKMKDASSGGLEDNVKNLKRGFNDLKDLFLGAGVVEGVKKFYDIAIESARKSTDANDQNAAAVRRFGDSLDAIKEKGASFATFIVGTFNRIGEQVGSGLKGIGAALTGTFDAWGEGERVLEATDKAARAAELSLAEAKKHADEFKKISEEIKNLTEAREQAERKALPIAEQKNILQQKLMEAQRAEVEAGDNALERRKAQVEQMKIGNALLEVQKTINDDQDKQDEKRRAEAEALNKTKRDGLEVADKIKLLTQEIADGEALIKSNAMSAKGQQETMAVIAAKRNELQDAYNKQKETEKKYDDELAKLGDKRGDFERESLSAQKAYNDAKKEEANLRKNISEMEDGSLDKLKEESRLIDFQKKTKTALGELAKVDKEISDLLLKGKENLNETEKERLKLLTGETTEVKQQTELHELTTKLMVGTLLPAEKERLAVLKGQTVEKEKQLEVDQKTKSLGVSFKSGADLSGMSSTALEGMLQRDQQRAQDLRNPANNYQRGGPVIYLDRLEAARLEAEAENIKKELAQRSEIANYARRFGETATIRQYGDTLAEKALADVRDTSTRTANSIETIADTLTQSGIFRK